MFPDVIVNLASATICFASACFPALVGIDTPKGEFQLQHYSTDTPGYGGDLLVFKETRREVFAIHRVLNVRGEQRPSRLLSPYPQHRLITAGCVNVDPTVYDLLMECCYASKITVQ